MTKAETAKLLAFMTTYWNTLVVNEARITSWHILFAREDLNAATAAVVHLATYRQSDFAPAPGAILKAIRLLTGGSDSTRAEEAYGTLIEAVRKFGYHQTEAGLGWLPPRIARAAKILGWEAICLSENPEALRAHFFRVYDAVKDVEQERAALEDTRAAVTDPRVVRLLDVACGRGTGTGKQ